jgi:hypothetical protein
MKYTRAKLVFLFIAMVVLIASCAPPQTADDKKRDAQQASLQEGNQKVGMPAIINFRKAKTMRMIEELCDQEIVTYTYLENMIPVVVPGHTALGGKLTFVGETISFPLPYAAQFTAPESMQTYNLGRGKTGDNHYYGVARLPQADPDGLFKPSNADATWILMKDPNSDKVGPVYGEPKIFCFPFKLKMDGSEEAAAAKAVRNPLQQR